jgi:eight-cysteine-cluster-containing protein
MWKWFGLSAICAVTVAVTTGCLREDFCGSSSQAACMTDADCTTGGCGGEVCQGAADEPVFTTCEYRACKVPEDYGLFCGCVDGRCGWR